MPAATPVHHTHLVLPHSELGTCVYVDDGSDDPAWGRLASNGPTDQPISKPKVMIEVELVMDDACDLIKPGDFVRNHSKVDSDRPWDVIMTADHEPISTLLQPPPIARSPAVTKTPKSWGHAGLTKPKGRRKSANAPLILPRKYLGRQVVARHVESEEEIAFILGVAPEWEAGNPGSNIPSRQLRCNYMGKLNVLSTFLKECCNRTTSLGWDQVWLAAEGTIVKQLFEPDIRGHSDASRTPVPDDSSDSEDEAIDEPAPTDEKPDELGSMLKALEVELHGIQAWDLINREGTTLLCVSFEYLIQLRDKGIQFKLIPVADEMQEITGDLMSSLQETKPIEPNLTDVKAAKEVADQDAADLGQMQALVQDYDNTNAIEGSTRAIAEAYDVLMRAIAARYPDEPLYPFKMHCESVVNRRPPKPEPDQIRDQSVRVKDSRGKYDTLQREHEEWVNGARLREYNKREKVIMRIYQALRKVKHEATQFSSAASDATTPMQGTKRARDDSDNA
jgi:hypothetical protein